MNAVGSYYYKETSVISVLFFIAPFLMGMNNFAWCTMKILHGVEVFGVIVRIVVHYYLFVVNHYRYLKIYTLNLLVVMHYCCCWWWWWEHLVLNAGRKMTKVSEQNAVPSHGHYVAAPVVNNPIDMIPDERWMEQHIPRRRTKDAVMWQGRQEAG